MRLPETGDPEWLREAEVSVVAVGLGEEVVAGRLEAARNIAVRAYPSEVADAEIEWLSVPGVRLDDRGC